MTTSHDHHHHDHDHSELSETELRVRALETILTEKGYVDPAALGSPHRGLRTKDRPAQRRAASWRRAWTGSGFPGGRLLDDAMPAVSTLGLCQPGGDHLVVAVENTPSVHNMVVCTLCSCYPWRCSGCRRSGTRPAPTAPAPSRTRAACSPTSASSLPTETEIRVWDSTAETRYSGAADAARRHRGLERSSSSPTSSPATP